MAAAVELPVGLEQRAGRGLTMWSHRLVAPYEFARTEAVSYTHLTLPTTPYV